MTTKLSFDIPTINNEKIALMRHLNLNVEDDVARAEVAEFEGFEVESSRAIGKIKVKVFEYGNDRFHVSHGASDMKAAVILEFNSDLWRIKLIPTPSLDHDSESKRKKSQGQLLSAMTQPYQKV